MVERRAETGAAVVASRQLVPRDHHCPRCGKWVTTSWSPPGIPPQTFYTIGKCEPCRAWRRFDATTGRPAARYGPIVLDSE